MNKATLEKQLMITVDNKVGTLAEISTVIAAEGINMIALCAYAAGNTGVVMFVSEDNAKAKRLLKAKKYNVREEEVVLFNVENRSGALQAITQRIANAGIDVTLMYGSVHKQGRTSPMVMTSEDNEAALTIIRMS